MKTFGVTTARRSTGLPDVPTLAEFADLPGYDCAAWVGYAALAGTPRENLARLAVEIKKAVQAADLKQRYIPLGMDVASNTPDEMAAYMRRRQDRYAKIIRDAKNKIENSSGLRRRGRAAPFFWVEWRRRAITSRVRVQFPLDFVV